MVKRSHSVLHGLFLVACITLTFIGIIIISSWIYTTSQLNAAQKAGVFSSAEEGMRDLIAKGYIGPNDYQILYAGTNSFDGSNPHVWYVIACVWGGHRVDGSPTGSKRHNWDQPGSFFLNTTSGWVHVSEGAFPQFIGFWMKVFGLAGQGLSLPTHDWDSLPHRDCDF
jgi:hypothetical protein